MARKNRKKTSFWDVKQGIKNVGGGIVQAGKEISSIPAYGVREVTGQSHSMKVRGTLKKGWLSSSRSFHQRQKAES